MSKKILTKNVPIMQAQLKKVESKLHEIIETLDDISNYVSDSLLMVSDFYDYIKENLDSLDYEDDE